MGMKAPNLIEWSDTVWDDERVPVSVANDYANDAYLIEVDFHYQMDTLGSVSELSKT